jgi:hypothetical protein
VVGNGVKKPRGFTTYASGTFAAGDSGKIEQIAAAAQGVIGWDDLINVLTALKEFYLGGANGRGLGRRDIDPQCDQRGSDRGQGDLDHHAAKRARLSHAGDLAVLLR